MQQLLSVHLNVNRPYACIMYNWSHVTMPNYSSVVNKMIGTDKMQWSNFFNIRTTLHINNLIHIVGRHSSEEANINTYVIDYFRCFGANLVFFLIFFRNALLAAHTCTTCTCIVDMFWEFTFFFYIQACNTCNNITCIITARGGMIELYNCSPF